MTHRRRARRVLASATSLLLPLSLLATPALSDAHASPDWLTMSDTNFALAFAPMAFSDDLEARQTVAWYWFARINQQIGEANRRLDQVDGQTIDTVPLWMTWPTDSSTFREDPFIPDAGDPRDTTAFVVKKDALADAAKAGAARSEGQPQPNEEEVTRNLVGYDYIVRNGLNTYDGVLDYVRQADTHVEMPIGSVETKLRWVEVKNVGEAPAGAMVIKFEEGTFWWAGIHIMAKMALLPDDPFSSEEPSWFWTTYQFTEGRGVAHVRDTLIEQKAPLGDEAVAAILAEAGLEGLGLENYSPNGTQIRFTMDGDGETPVIMGHTMMEDFAGKPNQYQPEDWTAFDSSCHTCHATAAINPETGDYFPFTVPIGTLADYQADGTGTTSCEKQTFALSDGFVSLDFMWPFPFQAKPDPDPCK